MTLQRVFFIIFAVSVFTAPLYASAVAGYQSGTSKMTYLTATKHG